MGQKIRLKTEEMGILGWVIPILADFPNFVEGCRIHPAQPTEMFYEGPPQRLACRHERERGKKSRCSHGVENAGTWGEGSLGTGVGEARFPLR